LILILWDVSPVVSNDETKKLCSVRTYATLVCPANKIRPFWLLEKMHSI
jgi:hypothetical protein